MNRLTIVLTGKKQSGKSTMCNYIRARYMNLKIRDKGHPFHFFITDEGLLRCKTKVPHRITGFEPATTLDDEKLVQVEYDETGMADMLKSQSVKVYSFADPLKDFCINVLGVPYEGCWGTDAQKNTPVPHLLWENLAKEYRPAIDTNNYASDAGEDQVNAPILKTGPMTVREIMQVFGTDICRRLYGDCWARGTYNKIKSEGFELALVADARFPNEITIGTEVQAYTVRLGRNVSNDNHKSEIALDNFPKEDYTLYIDNSDFTIEQQCAFMDSYIDRWFAEAGIK